ncbi:retrovirus-related pol polyprotein from transposon TNT 1-94 [Tanacetum coccineum]
MGEEHLDTIPEKESDELIKSSVENIVPIPSESEDFSDNESKCDMPICDDFMTFSNPLFDSNDNFTSSDDKSLSDEDVLMENFKIYSNPLFDDEEIVSPKIDPHYFNAESNLIESLLNRDILIDSSPKFDYLLEEFSGELAHIDPIPPGIEKADLDLEEEIRLVENLLYDNSSPRPPEELNLEIVDTILESLSLSPILVEDSDSLMEEINLFLASDESMPPGIEDDDYDSEGDIHFLEELINNDSLPFPENESSILDHFNDPSPSRPPPEPPDVEICFDFEPDTGVVTTKVVKGIFIEVQSERLLLRDEFSISFIRDPLSPVIDTLLSFSSKNEDKVYNPGILISPLLSHRGEIISNFSKSPMMIYGGDIPHLDVLIAIVDLLPCGVGLSCESDRFVLGCRGRGLVVKGLRTNDVMGMGKGLMGVSVWFMGLYVGPACALGKNKKSSHQPKAEDTNQEKLYLLHMDLCGLMRVESINGKMYILVIVDDYSRFTWVKFLRSKDEAPNAIIKCIKNIQVRLNATVRNVRTYNGTKFVNQTIHDFYENVIISLQTSVARTRQQNNVLERRNRTLMEAARTMLIFSKAHLFLWAELMHDKKPNLSFFHVFGSLCYPTNDIEDLGKLNAKANISIFVGYTPTKKAFRIYNRRTRKIIETIHLTFDELTAMASEQFGLGRGLQVLTPATSSSGLVSNLIPQQPFPVAAAPRAVEIADSPVSTSIDQDASSSSIPSTQDQEHSLIISQGVEEKMSNNYKLWTDKSLLHFAGSQPMLQPSKRTRQYLSMGDFGTGYSQKDKTEAKTDKTEHGMERA